MTWIEVTRRWALERGVADRWVAVLDALRSPRPRGGPPPPPERPWSESFEALERQSFGRPELTDVDAEQAAMFFRRVDAVSNALDDGTPEGRVLAMGMRIRLADMAREPSAIRVRALADFYYSQVAQLRAIRDGRIGGFDEAVRALEWVDHDGLHHAGFEGFGPMGPMHLQVCRLDPRRLTPRVVDLRGTDGDLTRVCREAGADLGTSGGFFLYSEPDIEAPEQRGDPVGVFVSNGRVVNRPYLNRPALLWTGDGVHLDRVPCEGRVNRASGTNGPDRASWAAVGDRVIARGRRLRVPLGGAVGWGSEPSGPVMYRGAAVREAMAGGPMLVRDGRVQIDLRSEDFWGSAPPVTFSQDETGDQNLLPRMAVGIDAEGWVVFAAVDGRDFDRALGMTLQQLGTWMSLLGCHTAMNLDGGSSKRMVVRGRPVDLSSTEVQSAERPGGRVRPVRTAILWSRRGDPSR